jgi:hypothetical protein
MFLYIISIQHPNLMQHLFQNQPDSQFYQKWVSSFACENDFHHKNKNR